MAADVRAADYKSDQRSTGLERPVLTRGAYATRSADASAVDDFLQKLARAIQQFRTYPPTSPLCQNAIHATERALSLLQHRDQVAFRIAPRELMVDEVPCGRGTLIEQELARRLHAASIAEVKIEHDASSRELSRFCMDLVRCEDRTQGRLNLIELLAEHGVQRVLLRPAYRPEVLEVGTPAPPLAGLIEQQQQRREELLESGSGPVNHLYPPDKGWVRLDPATPFATISLVDLALLSQDPAALATMLLRLTDGESLENLTHADALMQKFGDVATLFAALDSRVARVMFARLSRAVLDLDPDRRRALLRRTILPGLLDGRLEGAVLRDFPDVDLADSLCLLLDLETAAPEVVTSALMRLDLPPDKQNAVLPLLERRLRAHAGADTRDTSVDAHARRLVHVDAARARSLAEFSSFDLSVDARTLRTLTDIRAEIAATDTLREQLECLWKLTRLEANPELTQRFVERCGVLLGLLDREGHWNQLCAWILRYQELAASLEDTRPDVAEVIRAGLAALCTEARVARLLHLSEQGDDARATASAIVRALGPPLAPVLLEFVPTRPRAAGAAAVNGAPRHGPGQAPPKEDREASRKAAIALLCEHAALMAPALLPMFGVADVETDRVIARVLGIAGPGYEAALGAQLHHPDQQTVRETLRSLARIGTTEAAALVSAEIENGRDWVTAAAEEALWHFPPAEAHRQVSRLLGSREFVHRHAKLATRLLDRALHTGGAELAPIVANLAGLRFRVWKPSLMRLGRKARALEAQ